MAAAAVPSAVVVSCLSRAAAAAAGAAAEERARRVILWASSTLLLRRTRPQKSQKPEAVIPVTIKALTEVRDACSRCTLAWTTHTPLAQHQAVQRSTLDDTTMMYGHELGNVRCVR